MLRRCEFCSCGNTGSSLHQCLEHALAGTQAVVAAPAEYTEKRALESGIIGRFGSETHRFARFDNISSEITWINIHLDSVLNFIKYLNGLSHWRRSEVAKGKDVMQPEDDDEACALAVLTRATLNGEREQLGLLEDEIPVWPGFPSSSSFPIY